MVFLMCLQVSAFCNSPWDDFLENPNPDGLVMLKKSIGKNAEGCDFGNPINQSIAPRDNQLTKLLNIVEMGNESAFRAALMISKCLDGGDLEDFHRSVGMFFEKKPRVFLKIIKERTTSDSELGYFLAMLPLDSVDNIDLQLSMTKKRIKILKNIHDAQFSELKAKGLSILKKEMNFYEGIKVESKAP